MDAIALRQRVFDHPDDRDAYSVYADYLLQQGDPRGELIQLSLAEEDASLTGDARTALQTKQVALIQAHRDEWLGTLGPLLLDQPAPKHSWDLGNEYRFERGFLHTLKLPELNEAVAVALRDSPAAGELSRLYVRGEDYDGLGYAELAKVSVLSQLRFFQLGDDGDQCHTSGEGAAAVVATMPRLEELHLYVHNAETEALFLMALPNLRELTIHHSYQYPVHRLATNTSLTNLTSISFWPHALEPGDEEAYLTVEDVEALVASPNLPNLRSLELRLCSMGDEGIRLICESDLLDRLEVLDLTYGEVTDEGAQLLASTPATATLRRLSLSGNSLTSEGIAVLQALDLPELDVSDQLGPIPEDRVDAEYLWHGDIE